MTFTCPACDKPQRVKKVSKRLRCCFCSTETTRKVARAAGLLTNPNIKELFDYWSVKAHTRELDRVNGIKPKKKKGK